MVSNGWIMVHSCITVHNDSTMVHAGIMMHNASIMVHNWHVWIIGNAWRMVDSVIKYLVTESVIKNSALDYLELIIQ